jgi:hypothetical protein
VLAHLPSAGQTSADLAALAHAAGLLDSGQTSPTSGRLRTLRAHLRTLAQHQLAEVDEHGRWHRRDTMPATEDRTHAGQRESARTDTERRGHALAYVMQQRIAAERAEFRARVDPQARRARWQAQRQASLARAAKAARARQKAWWGAQVPKDRHRRRVALAAAFLALSPTDQAQRKHALAQARARAGESEPDRYAAWLAGIDSAELERRCLDRAARYAARPLHDRQQLVAAWAEHRARWGLPSPRRASSTAAAAPAPEAALLQRQPPGLAELVDELTLFTLDEPAPATRAS